MRIISHCIENDSIPIKYTCEGEDISPPLQFFDIPMGSKSLALIMEDPDAGEKPFDHWIVWNMHPNTLELSENEEFPHQGKNDFGSVGYRGPCPPFGSIHHYYFTLYALDIMLIDFPIGSSKEALLKEMEGHILERAQLMGTYSRLKK